MLIGFLLVFSVDEKYRLAPDAGSHTCTFVASEKPTAIFPSGKLPGHRIVRV